MPKIVNWVAIASLFSRWSSLMVNLNSIPSLGNNNSLVIDISTLYAGSGISDIQEWKHSTV